MVALVYTTKMKKLFIPFVEQFPATDDIERLATVLDTLPEHQIDNQPWPKFRSELLASFTIAHNGVAVLLRYKATEHAFKVSTFETNGSVHKDNCVEFFVSFGTEQAYYNIEMNCIGIGLIAYGEARQNRTFLPKQLVESIKSHIKIKTLPDQDCMNRSWEITMIIPIAVFAYSDLGSLKNKTAAGNFFKCGDDLPQPHFYSWNAIEADQPNFHLPDYFGELTFG
ncbi:MAG: hypothetical protein EOO88_12895 [Pedobacter sp.]|nr:MAG: hypothetical protein EOO88_12895 [Pedobacter sp.]